MFSRYGKSATASKMPPPPPPVEIDDADDVDDDVSEPGTAGSNGNPFETVDTD